MTPLRLRVGVHAQRTAVAALLLTACARTGPATLDAGALGASESPTLPRRSADVADASASEVAPSTPDLSSLVDEEFDALIRRVSIRQPPGDMPDGSVLLLESTVVEADTIKVKDLAAITVEAGEIRGRDVKTVASGYPTKAEPHLSMLYGQVVEGEMLETHHVRARLIIVDRLRAHTIRKLRKPLNLSNGDSGAPERNGCRSIAQGIEYANCGQWIYRPPRPVNRASSPADTGTPSSGTD